MKKNGLVIMGLIALCVILTAGVYFATQGEKGIDDLNAPTDIVKDVTPSEIPETPVVVVPDINTTDIPTSEPTTEPKVNDIPLTKIEDKPQPPEKPETAVDTDTSHDLPKDTKLTDPAKKPDSKPVEQPKPTETPKPNTPKNGDRNDKGQIYVEGFGWVIDGGANTREDSKADGDWDKIIGH